MHCDHCAARIEAIFQRYGSTKGIVNLKKKQLTVFSNAPVHEKNIMDQIEQLGYHLLLETL